MTPEDMSKVVPYAIRVLEGKELETVRVAIALIECDDYSFGTHVCCYYYHIGDDLYQLATTIDGTEIQIAELTKIDWSKSSTAGGNV